MIECNLFTTNYALTFEATKCQTGLIVVDSSIIGKIGSFFRTVSIRCSNCIKGRCIILLMRITKIHKVPNDPIPPTPPLFSHPSISKIAIPCTPDEDEKDPHQNRLPAGRTNIKQLHHFLRNQLIVVRQKERLISNHPIGRLSSISQLNRSVTRAICLKAEHYSTEPQEGNLPAITLPKIEKEDYEQICLESALPRRQHVSAATQHTKSRVKESISRNHGTRKRLSTLGDRRSSIEDSPLISNAYRHISRVKQGVCEYEKERQKRVIQKSVSADVVDFSLYRQCPQLNRVSLNLAIEISKSSKTK